MKTKDSETKKKKVSWIKQYLKVGDVVVVSTLFGGQRDYPVIRVEGNQAITGFRTFNTAVYHGGMIYEFGKRYDGRWTANGYWLKDTK